MNYARPKLQVNLIGWDNPAGLGRDLRLLKQVLEDAGAAVSITPTTGRSPSAAGRFMHRMRDYLLAARHRVRRGLRLNSVRNRYDVNLFLERPEAALLSTAPVNCLVPNQEWFQPGWTLFLGNFNTVFAKTRAAARTFDKLRCPVTFTSFTSHDRRLPDVPVNFGKFLHVAGRSPLKGTPLVLKAWARNPHWPMLTVVQNANQISDISAPNLRLIRGPIPDDELRQLQNECGVHLCPSEAEGFGHTLVEAMSCGALVVTTDGAPMNELVVPERGVLVPSSASSITCLGRRYLIEVEGFEQAVESLLKMPEEGRRSRGSQARLWFEQNDRYFREQLPRTVLGSQRECASA